MQGEKMKRTKFMMVLVLGLLSQGAMAKTLNVVTSFSILGDITQEVGESCQRNHACWARWRSAHL